MFVVHFEHCMVAAYGYDYYVSGVAVARSVVLEGPAPAFLSQELFSALIGNPDRVHVPLQSLPDSTLKDNLTCVGFNL